MEEAQTAARNHPPASAIGLILPEPIRAGAPPAPSGGPRKLILWLLLPWQGIHRYWGRIFLGEPLQPDTYVAFISYRHVEPDRRWAIWLHGKLETYRIPEPLRTKLARRRIGRVFRDEEELAASSHLSADIEHALDRSDWLIIICSPRSRISDWVNAEVEYFKKLGRADRVLALLIEGDPSSAFPEALYSIRSDVEARGLLRQDEPLAADVRSTPESRRGPTKRMARLRLVATMLGCRFDELRQREQDRRQRRLATYAGIVSVVLLGFATLAYLFFQERNIAVDRGNEAVTQRNLAVEQGNEAREQRDLAINNLGRVFMGRAERIDKEGDLLLAAKYALAGVTLAPSIADEQRPLLVSMLYRTGRLLARLPAQSPVKGMAINEDGSTLAVLGEDGVLRLFARNGEPIWTKQAHELAGSQLSLSNDGTFLLSSGSDGLARAYDFKSGNELPPQFDHGIPISLAVLSSDGRFAFTAARLEALSQNRAEVAVWRIGTAKALWRKPTSSNILAARFQTNGDAIAMVDDTGAVTVISAVDGKLRSRRRPAMGDRSFSAAAIDKTAHKAVLGGADGTATVVDLIEGKVNFEVKPEFAAEITSIDAGRNYFAVGNKRGEVGVFDLATGRMVGGSMGAQGAIVQVSLAGDERVVASADQQHTVRLATATNLRARWGPTGDTRLGLSNDGQDVALNVGVNVQVRRLANDSFLTRFSLPFEADKNEVLSLSFGRDGHELLVLDSTGRLTKRNLLTNADVPAVLPHALLRGAVASSGAVATVALGRNLTTVRLQRTSSVVDLPMDEKDDAIEALGFSRDGSRLAGATQNGHVVVWDVASGQEVWNSRGKPPPRGPSEPVSGGAKELPLGGSLRVLGEKISGLSLNSSGSLIAFGRRDEGLVDVYEIVPSRAPALIASIPWSRSAMSAFAFSKDNTRLAVGGPGGSAVFDIHSGALLAKFDAPAREVELIEGIGLLTSGIRYLEGPQRAPKESDTELWDLAVLEIPTRSVMTGLCTDLLGAPGVGFTESEIYADPLIRDIWLRDRKPDTLCR
jgi:WD40 repeat protein